MEVEILWTGREDFQRVWRDAKEEQVVVVMVEEACLALAAVVLLEGFCFDLRDYRCDLREHTRRNIEAFQVLARENLYDVMHEHPI